MAQAAAQIMGPAQSGFMGRPLGKLTQIREKMAELRTPGWQILVKIAIFLLLLFVFGMIYGSQINPEKWSVASDKDENDLLGYRAGLYASTVINSTVGYGDYFPLEGGQMTLVAINILVSWFLFSVVL